MYDGGVSRVGAYVLAILLAACSLIDPLDDISGGQRDAGAPPPIVDAGSSGTDAGAPREAGSSAQDSGIAALLSCATSPAETEPNDESVDSNPLTSGQQVCGVLKRASGDKDLFALIYSQTGVTPFELVVTASEPIDVEMIDTNKLPGRRTFKSDTTPVRGFANEDGVIQITLSAPAGATDILYSVTLSLPP